eukprot:GILK01005390.1.p1 GENE.GILK01005390.1~~GILK01005390.1.p1  ORF type:complete len:524 (+),score=87.75 GILK01005390.1:54-1574(+)
MAKTASSKADVLRCWTPFTLVIFLTVINLINYLDRGVMAGVVPKINDEWNLTGFQTGFLSGCFIFGYMCSSPVFAHFDTRFPPMRIVTFGLGVWVFATALAGFASNFYVLCLARTLTGIGEASFVSLAPPFVDDNAPPEKKTRWLALFFMAIPVGQAMGYMFVTVLGWIGVDNWHVAFFCEAVIMLPLAILTLFAPTQYKLETDNSNLQSTQEALLSGSKQRSSSLNGRHMIGEGSTSLGGYIVIEDEEGIVQDKRNTFWGRTVTLLSNSLYLFIVLGYSAYSFVVGGLAYWGPTYLVEEDEIKMSLADANIGFGALTVVCGLLGTVIGGVAQDLMISRIKTTITDHQRVLVGVKLSLILACIGFPFAMVASFMTDKILFFVFLSIAELFIFGTTAPINACLMASVAEQHRAQAMALSVLGIHLLGDFPSPMLFGVVKDVTSFRVAMVALSAYFSICLLFWFIAFALAQHGAGIRRSLQMALTFRKPRRVSAEVAAESLTASLVNM